MPSANLLLYPEDFAEPRRRAPPAPAPVAPGFSAADVAAARAAGRQEGEQAGRRAAITEEQTRSAALRARIADGLDGAQDAAAAAVEAAAFSLARLLFDALGTAFPTLSARCGEAEMRRVIAAILPALSREAAVTLHVAPSQCAVAAAELAALSLRRAEPPRVVADAAMADGDIEILWDGGRAVRDAASLWRDIAAALAPLGLLAADCERE